MSEAALPPLERRPPQLSARRCRRHPARDAAARCVDCGGDYCRECVSEHDGRLLCAACLEKCIKAAEQPRRGKGRVGRIAAVAVALLVLWLCFASLGELLRSSSVDGHATLVQTLPQAEDDTP